MASNVQRVWGGRVAEALLTGTATHVACMLRAQNARGGCLCTPTRVQGRWVYTVRTAEGHAGTIQGPLADAAAATLPACRRAAACAARAVHKRRQGFRHRKRTRRDAWGAVPHGMRGLSADAKATGVCAPRKAGGSTSSCKMARTDDGVHVATDRSSCMHCA